MRSDDMRTRLGALLVALLALGGCTDIENTLARIDALNYMHEAPSLDPYEAPREGPPLSVPVRSSGEQWEPAVEQTEAALQAWGDTMTNPLAMNEDVLTAGARGYQTYCAVCHGVTAEGDGPLVGPGKFPLANNLLLPATQERSDGYIYAIIRVGRGLMPSYRRIQPRERWSIVNYVRYLQQGGDPMQVDIPGLVQPGRDASNTAGQE